MIKTFNAVLIASLGYFCLKKPDLAMDAAKIITISISNYLNDNKINKVVDIMGDPVKVIYNDKIMRI